MQKSCLCPGLQVKNKNYRERIVFTVSTPRPIQSTGCNVRLFVPRFTNISKLEIFFQSYFLMIFLRSEKEPDAFSVRVSQCQCQLTTVQCSGGSRARDQLHCPPPRLQRFLKRFGQERRLNDHISISFDFKNGLNQGVPDEPKVGPEPISVT